MPPKVKHLFVLMLENRSFDHMFGFSGMTGRNAVTGAPAQVEGLTGQESNTYKSEAYRVTRGADFAIPADPGHEFTSVVDQLCGPTARQVPGQPYPPVNNSGFADSYAQGGGAANIAEVMKCYDTARQLPVLHTLASEFAVCDHWYSSMPGPTWPNRMFAHAGSSGGLDHSPTTAEIIEWETVDGFKFANGSIYDRLKKNKTSYHFYAGDDFPMVAGLKGVTLLDVHDMKTFKRDLGKKAFPHGYVFIEPSYNILQNYKGSTSQHPLADVRGGEALIKEVYETIRASSVWESSMLIITWDEHGGFYDHVAPPSAPPPGDTSVQSKYNRSGFSFAQYGLRVPAVVVSPWVPRNSIDHRIYDHSSIPATLAGLFGAGHLTRRDASANSVQPLLSLLSARKDAPMVLPAPVTQPRAAVVQIQRNALIGAAAKDVSRPDDSVNAANLPSILHSAARQDLLLSGAKNRQAILSRLAGIQTRAEAASYLKDVQVRVRAKRYPAS